jgi:hypothetical protein
MFIQCYRSVECMLVLPEVSIDDKNSAKSSNACVIQCHLRPHFGLARLEASWKRWQSERHLQPDQKQYSDKTNAASYISRFKDTRSCLLHGFLSYTWFLVLSCRAIVLIVSVAEFKVKCTQQPRPLITISPILQAYLDTSTQIII